MLEEALVASAMHVGDEVMCISVFFGQCYHLNAARFFPKQLRSSPASNIRRRLPLNDRSTRADSH